VPWRIEQGNCVNLMARMEAASVDAVVCDPPYSLEFMGRKWDSHGVGEDAGFGYYLAGLIDGEGCFRVAHEAKRCEFLMKLRADDRWILDRARLFIGHGRLVDEDSGVSKPTVKLVIDTKDGCAAVCSMLTRYPLRAKKLRDFLHWEQVVEGWLDLTRGNRWHGPADRRRLIEMGERLRAGRAYSDIPWSGNAYQDWTRLWATESLRVLKPGGHALVFGSSRTFHRAAAGLEDAGFEIRDTIMWLYAQGFPKSKDAGDGWGTALKPAHEPIIVARKPLEGTVAANMDRYGTGAMNIDATRIPFADAADLAEALAKNPGRDGEKVTSDIYGSDRPQQVVDEAGRWPANLVLDEGAGQMLDAQSGIRPGGGYPEQRGANSVFNPTSGGSDGPRSMGDTGGASRFFFCPKVGRLERDLGLTDFEARALLWSSGEQSPGTFQSDGTDRSARNAHPTVKPIELMRWLCRLVTRPGGTVLDPFAGSGSTGIAAVLESFDFIGMEREAEYVGALRGLGDRERAALGGPRGTCKRGGPARPARPLALHDHLRDARLAPDMRLRLPLRRTPGRS